KSPKSDSNRSSRGALRSRAIRQNHVIVKAVSASRICLQPYRQRDPSARGLRMTPLHLSVTASRGGPVNAAGEKQREQAGHKHGQFEVYRNAVQAIEGDAELVA